MYVCIQCLQVWICVCLWVSLKCCQVGVLVSMEAVCMCVICVCVFHWREWESLGIACLSSRLSLLHPLQCWALAREDTGRGRSGVERAGFPPTAWRKWCIAAKTTDQVITAHVYHWFASHCWRERPIAALITECNTPLITLRNLGCVFQRAVVNEPNAFSAITLLAPMTALMLPGKTSLATSRHWSEQPDPLGYVCTQTYFKLRPNQRGNSHIYIVI